MNEDLGDCASDLVSEAFRKYRKHNTTTKCWVCFVFFCLVGSTKRNEKAQETVNNWSDSLVFQKKKKKVLQGL